MSLDSRLDPEIAAALAAGPPRPTLLDRLSRASLAELRAARAESDATRPVEGVRVRDHRLPGPEALRVRIYRPEADAPVPAPCLVWFHGGGMVLGTPEADDARVSAYARDVGCVVVSVAYRLAPEHPHPMPVEDCYRALRWTAGRARALGIDPHRLAVGGISAGGGLAAA
ncbi:alpha/beta hydrolase, partial [Streptomyces sp. S5]|uniref:alpha/beta hydrolase n=1 Tax=Streptomyces sp. S5 TaxID=1456735 RepID=UPI0013CE4CDA